MSDLLQTLLLTLALQASMAHLFLVIPLPAQSLARRLPYHPQDETLIPVVRLYPSKQAPILPRPDWTPWFRDRL